MNDDGTCPTCGRVVEAPERQPITAKNLDLRKLAAGDSEVIPKTPWHFKLIMVLLVLYLGWRLVQLFIWIFT